MTIDGYIVVSVNWQFMNISRNDYSCMKKRVQIF